MSLLLIDKAAFLLYTQGIALEWVKGSKHCIGASKKSHKIVIGRIGLTTWHSGML